METTEYTVEQCHTFALAMEQRRKRRINAIARKHEALRRIALAAKQGDERAKLALDRLNQIGRKRRAFAKFERQVYESDMARAELEGCISEAPTGGTRKRAKHRIQSKPVVFGRIDAGSQSSPGVAYWRGERNSDHAKLVRKHRAKVRQSRANAANERSLRDAAVAGESIHVGANTH